MAQEVSTTGMCLLVDAIETRHRWSLSARYAVADKRATHESVAGVSRSLFLEENPGAFPPRDLFYISLRSPAYLSVLPGDNVFLKQKRSPQGALTEDFTISL